MKLAGEFRLGRSVMFGEGDDSMRFGDRWTWAKSMFVLLPLGPFARGEDGGTDVIDSFEASPPALSDARGGLGRPMLNVASLPRLKPFDSDCLRKASKSGFWSRGTTLGDAAAVECTSEFGGLQFVRGTALDMNPSLAASILSSK